jgi:hypothetical protein
MANLMTSNPRGTWTCRTCDEVVADQKAADEHRGVRCEPRVIVSSPPQPSKTTPR